MSITKNILLIDDNTDLRSVISVNLESQGYNIIQAGDGAEALNKLDQEKWYCIVCDLMMPHITGMMFLKIIRERGLKIPVIFITGLNNIIEKEEAFKLGAQAFITKPFENNELYQKLIDAESYNKIVNRSENEIELDDYYCKVHIDEFVMGKKILFPVFLKLSSSKFIKIAHSGEDLDQTKIDNIKKHGVEYFYLENSDYHNYLKRNISVARSLLSFREIKDEKKRDFFISISKNIVEYEFQREINPETMAMSLFAIHNTLIFVSAKKDFFKALQALHEFSATVVEHSLLVSLLASAIALQSEEFNNKTVLSVSLAALFHDFGLKELPKGLADKSLNKMSTEEIQLFKSHPQLGSQLMASIKKIPEVIPQAILHHHEHSDGSGYPFGIGRIKIHPIARILAVADHLASTWSLPENKDESFKAILLLIKDKQEILDKDYIKFALELTTNSDPLLKTKF
ncbi:MAG: response regulator [Bacteriovorax sp.]|nr:response regulator [Bacteriovorax sp.]